MRNQPPIPTPMNTERYEIAKQAIRSAFVFGTGVWTSVNEQMMEYNFEPFEGNELLTLINEVSNEIQ